MYDKLKSLPYSLPAFVLCSKATSSNVKYKNAWLNWKKWEKDNLGFNQFPVSSFLFCLYLRGKVKSCNYNSPASIEFAVYAVSWVHEIAGISSPTESSLVKQVLEASIGKAGARETVFRPRCDYHSCRKIQHPTGFFI